MQGYQEGAKSSDNQKEAAGKAVYGVFWLCRENAVDLFPRDFLEANGSKRPKTDWRRPINHNLWRGTVRCAR